MVTVGAESWLGTGTPCEDSENTPISAVLKAIAVLTARKEGAAPPTAFAAQSSSSRGKSAALRISVRP
jgi:hypothetical protein